MASNLPTTTTTSEIKIQQMFNGAFYQNIPISEDVYSIVYSFFLAKMNGLEDIAKTLTQSLLTSCYGTKINPIDILNEFNNVASESAFKRQLIAVLNNNRYPSSKIGYSRGITPNKWVQRNIVA